MAVGTALVAAAFCKSTLPGTKTREGVTMQAAERVLLPDGAGGLCSDSQQRGSDKRLRLIRDNSFRQGSVTGHALRVRSQLCTSPIWEIETGLLHQVPVDWSPFSLPASLLAGPPTCIKYSRNRRAQSGEKWERRG